MLGYNKHEDYTEMWKEDIKSVLATMYRNMADDLDCGYNPVGNSIRTQRRKIAEYEAEYFDNMEKLIAMEESAANRWCYMDMVRKGAIEP